MRWATVGSETRKARAISSVVRPPISRSVSATRASVASTGWQAVKTRRSRSSPMSSSRAASRSGAAPSPLGLDLAAELLVLALDQLPPAQAVDGAMLGGGHEPGARLVRDARLRPLLERGDERVLRQLLGEADVAHHAREAGDELGLLDAEDRVDGAMGIGSRHGYRYHHPRCGGCKVRGAAQCSAPQSPGPSAIWRISASPSHSGQCCLWSSMKRLPQSSASSLDLNENIA